MTTLESFGLHPYYNHLTHIFTLKGPGRIRTMYRLTKLTSKQKRKAKKEFRSFLKSGLPANKWVEKSK